MTIRQLNVLGIRGIPAAHGGFETFAEGLSCFLRDRGWKVVVYCQEDSSPYGRWQWVDEWQGIERIHIRTLSTGSLSTIEFDLRATIDVLRRPGIDLVLGYNSAIFSAIQRLFRRVVVMNMDGIEWKRAKWGKLARAWFWMNELAGLKLCSVAIADHPEIACHLASRDRKTSVVIPYGSHPIRDGDPDFLREWNIAPQQYFVSIARIEPENSIIEIVKAFILSGTPANLLVLGKLDPKGNRYHREVLEAANSRVIFPGAIYDPKVLNSIRFNCIAYLHGHQVGGTNPSLVEALGAGNAVIAHDNKFNRWTAGNGAIYFSSIIECAEAMKTLFSDSRERKMRSDESMSRHSMSFSLDAIHSAYMNLFEKIY